MKESVSEMIEQERIQSTTGLSISARRLLLATASALLLLALYAHIEVARAGDDYAGLLLPLDRLFDLSPATGLLISAFAAGWTLCNWLGLEFVSATEEISISGMLGTGIIGTLVLGLGLAGLLTPIPVAMFLIAISYVSRKGFARLITIINQEYYKVCEDQSHRILFLLFTLLIGLIVLHALTPPISPDEAIYHLPVTREFVRQGRIFPVYDNFSGNMPFLIHMIYALCLMAKSDIAARLFSLFLGILIALAVHGFCIRFLTRRAALVALFALFASAMVVEVGITTRVDLSLAGILFASLYSMLAYLKGGNRGWLYTASALSGFALAVKYTAGAWLLVMGLILIADSLFIKRERLLIIVKDCVVYSVIALALASPWLIKNQVWFGNPVYPYLTGEVAEHSNDNIRYFNEDDDRKLKAHFETAREEFPRVLADIEKDLTEAASYRLERHPFRFWEYFTTPNRYNIESGETDHTPNYLFLFAPLALLFAGRRWTAWLFVISVSFYLFVASTAWIGRYFLPVYPALTVLAAYGLTEIGHRFRERAPLVSKLPVILVAIAVLIESMTIASRIHATNTLRFNIGSISRHQFMSNVFYYPLVDYVNRNTPAHTKVMLMGYQMGYDLKRDYLDEAGWDSIEWRRLLIRNSSFEDVYQDLKGQGITYILYSPSLFKFTAFLGREGSGPSGSVFKKDGQESLHTQAGIDYEIQIENWMTFEIFRRKYTELEVTGEGCYLLRLK